MNNLKKVLALALALVMLLGMFTVATAAKDNKMVAADLTDWNSVSHKDAVALMVDLGIINGKPDGSFDPTGAIDRASWAKMAYYAATGSDDVTGFKGADCGLKDISDNWAEGYIAFLAAAGYVSGDNVGNFNPGKNVTVAEACKIMLTILGYDANDRGYQNVGSTWSGNVMTDAKRNGLMNNVDRTQAALTDLTRENAAEIVYNALQANTVEPEPQWDAGNKYITKYNKLAYLGYDVFGIVKVDVKLDSVDPNGYGIFTGKMKINDTDTNMSATTLNGKVKASMDVAGEMVSLFIEGVNATFEDKTGEIKPLSIGYKSTVSSTVARTGSSADAVLTGGFKWADLTDSSSEDYVAASWPNPAPANENKGIPTDATFYINGAKAPNAQKAIDDIQTWTYDTNAGSEFRKLPGTVVEFYLGDEGEISTVKAYHYTVAQLEGDAETRTYGGKLQVRVPGVAGLSSWTDADRVSGYQGLAENDVVLYYRDSNDNSIAKYVVEKAEMVTGKVTRTDSSKAITVNGNKYKRTAPLAMEGTLTPDGQVGDRTDFSSWNSNDRDIEFNFYLDKNGTVCFTEQVSDSVNKGNVALVLAAEWTGTDMATAAGKLEAKLLFIDGTTDIVTISKVDMDGAGLKSVVTSLSSVESTAARQIIGGPKAGTKLTNGEAGQAITLLADTKIGAANAAFFNYKVVDGKYELTKVIKGNAKNEDDWTETVSANDVAIDKVADFTNGGIQYAANGRTTFVVAKGEAEAKEFYTYTSYKNVPATKSAYVMAVGTYAAPNAAAYVYIDTESYTDDVPDGYKFIYTNNWSEDDQNEDCVLVSVVNEDGSQATVSMTTSLFGEMKNDSNKFSAMNPATNTNTWVGKFVKVGTVDEKGVISELDDTGIVLGDIAVLGDDVVQVEGDTAYATDGMTKFVYVDLLMDDGDDTDVASDDTLVYSSSSTFKPDGFYKANQVGEPEADALGQILMKNATTTYRDVKMVVIPNADGKIADFVYVVRVLW